MVWKLELQVLIFLLDVRTWYIRFALSFLRTDSAPIISEVLTIRGFLDNIFLKNEGLVPDNPKVTNEPVNSLTLLAHL